MAFRLDSSAFADGDSIPQVYTCDGADLSPPLHWTEPPAGTRTFVLMMEDLDGRDVPRAHWIVYNLQHTVRELAEGVPPAESLANGKQGFNDFGKAGYNGPCPPPGPAHRYRFTLSALDAQLYLGPKPTKLEVEEAMAGHTLARATLTGRYGRRAISQVFDTATPDLHFDLTDYGQEGGEAADFLHRLADQGVTAEEAVAAAEYRQRLHATLAAFQETLHGEERSIFSQRLWTERPLSVQEVADQHGLSGEQVRQVESRVKAKLKAYLVKAFADFPDLDVDFLEHLEKW